MINKFFSYKKTSYISKNTAHYLVIPSLNKPRVFIANNEVAIENGIRLYNPYGKLSRLYKKVIAFSGNLLLKNGLLVDKIDSIAYSHIYTLIMQECKRLFNEEKIFFNIYIGTPGKHQKAVFQILEFDGRILGYVKIGESLETKKLISNEVKALRTLEEAQIYGNVPKKLYYKEFQDFSFSIQTSIEGFNISSSRDLTYEHVDFLIEMYEKYKRSFVAVSNDYEKQEKRLLDLQREIGDNWFEVIDKSIFYLKNNLVFISKVPVHGDFAPWNMYINNSLHVFDWEYFEEYGNLFQDVIHYFIQFNLLVKKVNNAQKIVEDLLGNTIIGYYSEKVGNKEILNYLMLYLLNSTLYQLEVDENNIKDNLQIDIRIEMIDVILRKVTNH